MLKYVLKRVILAIVSVFIIITLTFFLMNAVPGGPFDSEKAPDPAVKAVIEARYHLDKPLIEQYGIYLKNLANGDFGISLKTGRGITGTILESFSISVKLGGIAMLLAVIFGLSLGCLAAIKRNKFADRSIVFMTTLFVAVPSFILATYLLRIFCTKLGWFPAWQVNQPWHFYILPIIALMLYPMSYITRLTKSSMLDVFGQDYIRTARAKGVSEKKVVFKHALKNALIPVITYVGPMTAYIVTGSLVVEKVFTIGGLGSKFVTGITDRDYPMIMATTIFLAVLVVIMTLINDLLYKVVDPRISFD